MSYRASVIKSIQYGQIAFGAGDTSKTATITAVVVANSTVSWLGSDTTSTSATVDLLLTSVVVTDTTTVTATRLTASNNSQVVGFVVTQYYPYAIRSNQDFVVHCLNGGTNATDATITTVNTAKTTMIYRGSIMNNAGQVYTEPERWNGYLKLKDATTVTATRTTNVGAFDIYGTALEFA